ncbi:MAG TPA: YihY/virulence factor BrkB family protein [Syntrophorhabdales bacterium]|nr:YihY/virulence factor BrkB family protein [Syntrophorhabdales bacterium]
MKNKQQPVNWLLGRSFSFLLRVLRSFMRNQGLLLSGALAYYTLLSIVPLSILALIVLPHFIGEGQSFYILSTYIGMMIPGYGAILTEQMQVFLQHRQALGIIGFVAMLFFSSMAFTVLENAMSVIFMHRVRVQHRHFLTSAVIPYLYILSIGLAIVVISFITGALEILEKRQLIIFGWSVSLELTSRIALYVLGVLCEVLLLSSIYLLMPVGHIAFHHALIGGITATILWEFTRRALVWYYSNLSMVNVIYGSFATTVVALLITEAISLILLLGAQVIAELEHKTNELGDGTLSGFET